MQFLPFILIFIIQLILRVFLFIVLSGFPWWKHPYVSVKNLFIVQLFCSTSRSHKYFYDCQRWNQLPTDSTPGWWLSTIIKPVVTHKYSFVKLKCTTLPHHTCHYVAVFATLTTKRSFSCNTPRCFCFFFSLLINPLQITEVSWGFLLKGKIQRVRKAELETSSAHSQKPQYYSVSQHPEDVFTRPISCKAK